MRLSSDEIRRLSDLWRQNAVGPAGHFRLDPETERYRLRANDIGFHELDYDELCTACVELTKQLLLPGFSSIIDPDHFWLWSWCAELLLGRNGSLSSSVDPEIGRLAQVTARAALAGVNAPTPDAAERAIQVHTLLNQNAAYLIGSSQTVLSYLCFPLLEAVARRACSAYVGLNGEVRQPFARANGGLYKTGKPCSNVGDVLRLLRDHVAGSTLRNNLAEILTHVANMAGESDGCSVIFDWRNSSLHGETTLDTIGGTVYTLSLLIALDGIESSYIEARDEALKWIGHRQWIGQLSREYPRSPLTYYPPFLSDLRQQSIRRVANRRTNALSALCARIRRILLVMGSRLASRER